MDTEDPSSVTLTVFIGNLPQDKQTRILDELKRFQKFLNQEDVAWHLIEDPSDYYKGTLEF